MKKIKENLTILRIISSSLMFLFATFYSSSLFISNASFIVAYIVAGYPVIKKAFSNIFYRRFFLDENLLMTIATFGAIGIGKIPEAGAVMIFYSLGEYLENSAVRKSKREIRSLVQLKPDITHVIKGDKVRDISPFALEIGDIILLKPGEKLPVDGKVISGDTFFDYSIITGESKPVFVQENTKVLSGALNLTNPVQIEVVKKYSESTLSRIINLVENAVERKSNSEKFITKFAKYYTPSVVLFAFLLAIFMPILTNSSFNIWFERALIFLVISCPCALVISIPLASFAGIGSCARNGILVKGANFLESASGIRTIVFDKTGTVTEGKFKVAHILRFDSHTEKEILETAAVIESHSNHPVALSISNAYGKSVPQNKGVKIKELKGKGMVCYLQDGTEILVGNCVLMEKFKVSHRIDKEEEYGNLIHVAHNKKLCGVISVKDKIRKEMKETLKSLRKLGIKRFYILSGDTEETTREVACEIGIENYFSRLSPEQKVLKMHEIREKKGVSAFVGDGINDAPVLASADIGIAMGGIGQNLPVEVSDIVITGDNLLKIPLLIRIAKKTKNIIWQNIFLALGIKFLFLVLGTFGIAKMWEAVFADMGVALLALLNSVRVLREKSDS